MSPGTTTVRVIEYESGCETSFTVTVVEADPVKKANPMEVKAKTVKVKLASVRKKAQYIRRSKAITVKNARSRG